MQVKGRVSAEMKKLLTSRCRQAQMFYSKYALYQLFKDLQKDITRIILSIV